MCTYKAVQLTAKLQHTETRSAATWPLRCQCYRPAVFFCHLRFIALWFPEGKFRGALQDYSLNFFKVLKSCKSKKYATSNRTTRWVSVYVWTHARSHPRTQQQQPQSTSQRCSNTTYHPISGGAVNTQGGGSCYGRNCGFRFKEYLKRLSEILFVRESHYWNTSKVIALNSASVSSVCGVFGVHVDALN